MTREATPDSLVDADQKTKKRIQNRVAQRTYRESRGPLVRQRIQLAVQLTKQGKATA